MAWPITRLATYAALTQANSAHQNSIQDAINVLHAPRSILGSAGQVVGTGANIVTNDGALSTGAGAGRELIIPLDLPVGKKIASIECIGTRLSTGNITYFLYEEDNAAGGRTGLNSAVGTAAGRESVTIAAIAKTLLASKSYYVSALGAGGGADGAKVFMIVVTFE